MKTVMIEHTILRFPREQRLEPRGPKFARQGATQPAPSAWLPAPPAAKPRELAPGRTHTKRSRSSSESIGERILFGLLVLSAIVAVGYGFNCLLDLVGNWAGFNSGVAQLLH